MKLWQLLLLTISADAFPQLKRSSFPGIATFNDYASQSTTVCGPQAGQPGTYAAAASDLSANISGGKCAGTIDPSKCNGQSPVAGYVPPSCPKNNCGTCYQVTNAGKTIIVQIVDSCPSTNAANFCKTDVPANNRCSAPGVNQLDIDRSAYQALTGQPFGSGGNLQITISESSCSGGGTDTTGSDTVGADPVGSGTTPAGASSSGTGAQPQTNANTKSPVGLASQKLEVQPQTNASTTSSQQLGSQQLGAQPKSLLSTVPSSGGSSGTTNEGTTSNLATEDKSKAKCKRDKSKTKKKRSEKLRQKGVRRK